eukprot:GHVL01012687.1.p1 GENE.GHVL01012687.1~~GHVL01012687.1.p1  ORF type:complete len:381 (+),score=45.75 GHVL01012687.1:256-1398(+)
MLFHIVEKKKRSRPMSPKAQLEQEKRMRREIANSNERRRMQCINAGFESLRALMPQLVGEKVSKAAILQHTTEYIANLEDEKNRVQSQNDHLKRILLEVGRERDVERELTNWENHSPPPKRKKRDTESSDEGISMVESTSDGSKDIPSVEDVHRELLELRQQIEREQMRRAFMEQRNRDLEAQLALTQTPSRHLHPHPPSSHQPSPHQPSPINLKVETHLPKAPCHVQEVSAHEDRSPSELTYNPLPRRNLENLVEAIRQIEGDSVLCAAESQFLSEDPHMHRRHHHTVLNSEESEKESSVSDPEESKSESSGRDSPSPPPMGLCARSLALSAAVTVSPSPPQMAHHQGILSEKYPIASHLLHRPSYTQFYRPGVIVHKS